MRAILTICAIIYILAAISIEIKDLIRNKKKPLYSTYKDYICKKIILILNEIILPILFIMNLSWKTFHIYIYIIYLFFIFYIEYLIYKIYKDSKYSD